MSDSITSSEDVHSLGPLQVLTSPGKNQILLLLKQALIFFGAGFFTLDVNLEGKRIFPFPPLS